MTSCTCRRVLFAFSLILLLDIKSIGAITQNAQESKDKISKNDIEIIAYRPKGLRVVARDKPDMHLFLFNGNVNRHISQTDIGSITGSALNKVCDKWFVHDADVMLKVGDVINYYVFVSLNNAGYILDQLSYKITALEENFNPDNIYKCESINEGVVVPSTEKPNVPVECVPSVTRVRGRTDKLCSGDVILTDNFDNKLDEDLWQIEQYIPLDQPDYPFMSYQNTARKNIVNVASSSLQITPKLQQNMPGFTRESIYTGTLDLTSRCTKHAETCIKQAFGANILPPVASGKVTSRSFAFLYGTVEVRAKLPQGDWVYPEILLEPVQHKYGVSEYASGLLKIASARGNRELFSGPEQYGNKLLYGGPIIDSDCHLSLLSSKMHRNGSWGDDFHVYSLRWAPDEISLRVDGEQWLYLKPDNKVLHGGLPNPCEKKNKLLQSSRSRIAPFDDFFQIALGVGVGGVLDFPDDTFTTGGNRKPWTNRSSKALLNFWKDLDFWYDTWRQPLEPRLVVDYVTVKAL